MARHECYIGILHRVDCSELVTFGELLDDICNNIELNKAIETGAIFRGITRLRPKYWTIKQYADKRIGTNLMRFDYCPICGKKIKWDEIRRAENG